jgi:hypothetical protein
MTPMRMHVTRRNFVLGGAAVGLGGCAYLLTPNILRSQPSFDLPDKPSGFRDTAGRELVAANLADQRTGVFLATGQSLAGDHVQGFYQPRHEVLNFNIYDGRLYRYIDPPLGPTFTSNGYQGWNEGYGALWGEVGDLLIEAKAFDRVGWAVPAIGGTTIQEWSDGAYRDRNLVAVRRLKLAGLQLSGGISVIGESDGIAKTDPALFKTQYLRMIDAVRKEAGSPVPWFVTQDTWAYGLQSEPIRRAQRELVDPANGIFFGGDLDQFGDAFRYEEIAGPTADKRVHPSAKGRAAMASVIAAAMIAEHKSY